MFGLKAWTRHLQRKAARRIIAATEDQSRHGRFVAEQASKNAATAQQKIQSGRRPTTRERKALQEQVLGRKVP